MKFDHAVVLGTGTLPLSCALLLEDAGLPSTIYDMDEKPSGLLARRAQAENISCQAIPRKQLFQELASVQVPVLVVSAINPCILPEKLLANPMITAINCHQALLPRHPGRNAEMWALYEGDEKTGITWHMLTNQVDGGDILIQKEMAITPNHTSYLIFKEQIDLAKEGFRELVPDLLNGTLKPEPQKYTENRVLHYSKDTPNNGFLDPHWDAQKISAFLRAMDYSILQVVPKPRISIKGTNFIWKKYKICREKRFPEGIFVADSSIFIQKTEFLFELCKYQKEDI